MKIILVKRVNSDYLNTRKIDYFGDEKFDKMFEDDVISLWNHIFSFDYFDFRKEIVNLQNENLKDCEFDEYHENCNFIYDDEIEKDLDAYYYFIDDDDWIHPNLSKEIKKLSNDYKMIVWDWYNYNIKNNCIACNEQLKGNWYGAIQTNHSICKLQNGLIHHCDYNDYYHSLYRDEYTWICQNLSVTNWNLTSLSLLLKYVDKNTRSIISKDELLKYTKMSKNLPKNFEILDEYFQPFVFRLNELYKELNNGIRTHI